MKKIKPTKNYHKTCGSSEADSMSCVDAVFKIHTNASLSEWCKRFKHADLFASSNISFSSQHLLIKDKEIENYKELNYNTSKIAEQLT